MKDIRKIDVFIDLVPLSLKEQKSMLKHLFIYSIVYGDEYA